MVDYLRQNRSGFDLRATGQPAAARGASACSLARRRNLRRLAPGGARAAGRRRSRAYALAQAIAVHALPPPPLHVSAARVLRDRDRGALLPTWQALAGRPGARRVRAARSRRCRSPTLALVGVPARPAAPAVPGAHGGSWPPLAAPALARRARPLTRRRARSRRGLALLLAVARAARPRAARPGLPAHAGDASTSRRCPKDAVIAGDPIDLKCVPVTASRAVVISTQLAFSYERGYFLEGRARMFDDAARVLRRRPPLRSPRSAARYGATHLLVNRRALRRERAGERRRWPGGRLPYGAARPRPAARRRARGPAPARPAAAAGSHGAAGDLRPPVPVRRTLLLALLLGLALAAPAAARAQRRRDRDRRPDRSPTSTSMPADAAADRRPRRQLQQLGRVAVAVLPVAGDVPHRAVRAQPRRPQHRPAVRRLQRRSTTPSRSPCGCERAGYEHRARRQVHEPVRQGRPQLRPARLDRLARACSGRRRTSFRTSTMSEDGRPQRVERQYQTDVLTARSEAFVRRARPGPAVLPVDHLRRPAPRRPARHPRAAARSRPRCRRRCSRTRSSAPDAADARVQRGRRLRQAGRDPQPPALRAARSSRCSTTIWRKRQQSLLSVDQGVRRIVRALEDAGELENTLLVFTSDNGYMIGEHRIRESKVLPYEPSIRVPLLMRGPGIPRGATRSQLVWNGDLAPTILEAAGRARRVGDGRHVAAAVRPRRRGAQRPRRPARGPAALADRQRAALHRAAHDRATSTSSTSAASASSTTCARDPHQLQNLAGSPARRGAGSASSRRGSRGCATARARTAASGRRAAAASVVRTCSITCTPAGASTATTPSGGSPPPASALEDLQLAPLARRCAPTRRSRCATSGRTRRRRAT